MFYMWRGNIVLIDSFSDIILLDFSVFNILVEYIILSRHFSESVHFYITMATASLPYVKRKGSADRCLWRNLGAIVWYLF